MANIITGSQLRSLPTYNGTSTADATQVVKDTVKNIRSRRGFTNGTEFVASVTDSVSAKHPNMTRGAVTATVYRVLAKYFA